MYQAIGLAQTLKWFGILCAVIIAGRWLHSPTHDAVATFALAVGSVSGAGLLVAALGQTPLFPLICKIPGIRSVFPPIDGTWSAALKSNWPLVAERSGLTAVETPVSGKVQIVARLFFVRINFLSMSPVPKYLTSKTVAVKVGRDPEDGSVRLYYVYVSEVRSPVATDNSRHYGAAYLDVARSEGGEISLEGIYWTERNWAQALNTAGEIVLTRKRRS